MANNNYFQFLWGSFITRLKHFEANGVDGNLAIWEPNVVEAELLVYLARRIGKTESI